MNETLQRWLAQASEFWNGLTTAKKISVGVFALLIAVAGAIGWTVSQKDPYKLLYSDLVPEDVEAVSRKLSELNIQYEVSTNKKSISVPESTVARARMELAKEGLPGQDVVGFEKFDSMNFGMTNYVQRIQYVRAVQGELVRSIQRLGAVKRARVHLSLPPKKTFLEEQDPPKASVILELHRSKELSKVEVKGIAHLVASAVEGLKVRQVTIVDGQGKFLHRPDVADDDMMASGLLEKQLAMEQAMERRVVGLLSPVVGDGKVMAKVTVELDPARVNTTQESFDTDNVVTLSSRKNDETSSGSRPNPLGIPGSRANLPGSEVENPPIPMARSNTDRNFSNNTFAIPRKVERIDKPSGGIKRLTVAVIVDGYYAPSAQNPKVEAFTPRSEEELRRLQDVVANAVGYDPQRRDSINISSLPFEKTELPEVQDIEAPFNVQELLKNLLKNGLIALVILLFFTMVVRPFLRWTTLREVEEELQTLPQTVAELEAARADEGVLALSQAANTTEESEDLDKKEGDDLKDKIINLIESAPKKGQQIVTEWIESDHREDQLEAA